MAEYDVNGLKLSSKQDLKKNNSWVNFNTSIYTYDEKRNLIEFSFEESENNFHNKTNYIYDDFGNVIKCDNYKWNYTNDVWEQVSNGYLPCYKNGEIIIDYFGRTAFVHWLAIEPIGVSNLTDNQSITLYPNPANSILNIKGIENQSIATLYSVDGKLLQTNNLTNSNSEININKLNSGIYILKIQNKSETVVRRFVKQ